LIRKEHVRCRYGVFKVRASSSPPYTKAAHRTRQEADVRDDTVLQSSTACGRPSRGPTRERGRRCSRRIRSSDGQSASSGHQRARQPPE
jgi:hypothetical protein